MPTLADGPDPTRFVPYSSTHAAAAAVCAAILVVLIFAGRRASPPRERLGRHVAGWISLGVWLVANVYWCVPPQLDVARSLPLHLCDVAGVIAPISMLSEKRWPRVLMYFWGLLLSSQGFIQPTLTAGPATFEFWLFWATHLIIVGSAIYDIAVRRLRLTRRDLAFALAASWAYAVPIFIFNWAAVFVFKWSDAFNYGYVGPKLPSNGTILNALGSWPLRALWLALIGSAAMIAAYLPWELVGERSTASEKPS